MASNALVAVKNPDNTYTSIYCHYDGYLEDLGVCLHTYYNTYEKIKELISYGDASSIDKTIEKCEFYSRDEGEEWAVVQPTHFEKFDHLLAYKKSWMFLYVFDGEKWSYSSPESKLLVSVDDALRDRSDYTY